MQYINWLSYVWRQYVLEGLALQAFLSAITLALLVHFHCPIWPAMLIGTWLWAPVVTAAFGTAVLLTVVTWLCHACAWSWHHACIGWYEIALSKWFDVLHYAMRDSQAYAIAWPGYTALMLLVVGAWAIYTSTVLVRGWSLLRIALLWAWIGCWCTGTAYLCRSESTITLATPRDGAMLVIHISGDQVVLYDDAGILSTGRIRAVWLQRIILPELIKRGYTCIHRVYTPRITAGLQRKCRALSASVGAAEPQYQALKEI